MNFYFGDNDRFRLDVFFVCMIFTAMMLRLLSVRESGMRARLSVFRVRLQGWFCQE